MTCAICSCELREPCTDVLLNDMEGVQLFEVVAAQLYDM